MIGSHYRLGVGYQVEGEFKNGTRNDLGSWVDSDIIH